MSPVQKKRMIVVISLVSGLSLALGLVLFALRQNVNLFYAPSELALNNPTHKPIRVGGMVVKGSVVRHQDLSVEFVITDYNKELKVNYKGILPDLFKENQGVVVRGTLDNQGQFTAKEVLAKHDENYMPPEVAKSLKGKTG